MNEPKLERWSVSDGYAIHVARWLVPEGTPLKGRVAVLHGVQSHGGWYHNLGRRLAEAGYEVVFPDRRGSGANTVDRGHAPSSGRLIRDVTEHLRQLREAEPRRPVALAGISWGGKLVVTAAVARPDLADAIALICPGLSPRVGVSRGERLRIAAAYLTDRHRRFPIPLADPALFTGYPQGQAFIAGDPLGLREATAGLLAASTILDLRVRRALRRVRQPALLMLAGRDRIVDNSRTRQQFERMPGDHKRLIEYPDGHHTLEFEPDPDRYALDLAAWLDEVLDPRSP